MDNWVDYEAKIEKARYIQNLVYEDGQLPSPIDLNISKMSAVDLNPLSWSNYDVPPKKLKLTNTGRTVILSAKWLQERAYLCDGPFLNKYLFSQIHFHWGIDEMEGSEHRFDGASSPMEMHVVHFKSDYRSQELAVNELDGVAVLVYAFRLQTDPNPALEEIVGNLPFIQNPNTSVRLDPWQITNLLKPFTRDYFLYWGSVPFSNRKYTILWLVCREPVAISPRQVGAFRTLLDKEFKPLLKNCRSVQNIQNRSVLHADPSGSLYASLLPVSYNPLKLRSDSSIIVEPYN